MAADTQLTGEARTMRVCKVFRLPDGGVASGCGNWAGAYAGLKWLADGEKGEPPDIDGADLLIYRPDGVLWLASGRWPAFPLLDKCAALGSGSDLALAALLAGKSPVDAVKAAFPVDLNSSYPVQAMDVFRSPDFPPATTHKARK